MKTDFSFSSPRKAFTLVEVLVSLTVLALLVALVSNITNNATRGITGSGNRIEADSEARTVFNRLAIDLARMLRRADLDFSAFKNGTTNEQLGNDSFIFYAETQGYADNPGTTLAELSPYSLVGYKLPEIPTDPTSFFMGTVLTRAAKARTWDEGARPGSLPVLDDDADYVVAGSQTFRLEYTYLLKPDPATGAAATLSNTPYRTGGINGFRDVAAIVVAIGVLDSKSRAFASNGQRPWDDASLVTALPDVLDGSMPLTAWTSTLNGGTFASASGLPERAANNVRVYQRYFYLDQ